MGKARDFIWTPIQTDNRPLLYHTGVIWIVSQCGPRHWSAEGPSGGELPWRAGITAWTTAFCLFLLDLGYVLLSPCGSVFKGAGQAVEGGMMTQIWGRRSHPQRGLWQHPCPEPEQSSGHGRTVQSPSHSTRVQPRQGNPPMSQQILLSQRDSPETCCVLEPFSWKQFKPVVKGSSLWNWAFWARHPALFLPWALVASSCHICKMGMTMVPALQTLVRIKISC